MALISADWLLSLLLLLDCLSAIPSLTWNTTSLPLSHERVMLPTWHREYDNEKTWHWQCDDDNMVSTVWWYLRQTVGTLTRCYHCCRSIHPFCPAINSSSTMEWRTRHACHTCHVSVTIIINCHKKIITTRCQLILGQLLEVFNRRLTKYPII